MQPVTMQPVSRSRLTIASVVTAFVATIVALGLCELALRLRHGDPLRPVNIVAERASFREGGFEYDPVLGWRNRANRTAPTVTGEYGVRMNSAVIKPLPSNAILAVGDSFTAGNEVYEHETYSAQLESITGYPVINAGVAAYGTDQMILAAERLIPLLHPALIVVGILDHDILRAGTRIFMNKPKPWFEVRPDGELVHHNHPVPPPVSRDQNNSAPWFAYSDLAMWAMGRLGRSDLLYRISEPVDNDPVPVSCALLRRLQGMAEAEHIRVLVLMIYGGLNDISALEDSTERQYAAAVVTCARGAGMETLDLWDEMVRLMQQEPRYYRSLYHRHGLRWGHMTAAWGHMTAAGNALLAQQIAQWLVAARWLPQLHQDTNAMGR